jgi:hypothetical protein
MDRFDLIDFKYTKGSQATDQSETVERHKHDLNKPESSGSVGLPVHDDPGVLDIAGLSEEVSQILSGYRASQFTHVQSATRSHLLDRFRPAPGR